MKHVSAWTFFLDIFLLINLLSHNIKLIKRDYNRINWNKFTVNTEAPNKNWFPHNSHIHSSSLSELIGSSVLGWDCPHIRFCVLSTIISTARSASCWGRPSPSNLCVYSYLCFLEHWALKLCGLGDGSTKVALFLLGGRHQLPRLFPALAPHMNAILGRWDLRLSFKAGTTQTPMVTVPGWL